MIKRFLSYVEIMTKITSVFAFIMTLAYLFYIERTVNWKLTIIFFVSMFLFDLTTTAINNYTDTKTNDQVLQFKRGTALFIIYALLALSVFFGILLVSMTDIVVLLLGGLCFLCGIFYTYGPVPISRQPLGEVFSGVFYGFFIPFILLYINMPAGTYLDLGLSWQTVGVSLRVWPLITVILLSAAGALPVCRNLLYRLRRLCGACCNRHSAAPFSNLSGRLAPCSEEYRYLLQKAGEAHYLFVRD